MDQTSFQILFERSDAFQEKLIHTLEGRHVSNDRLEKIWPLVLVVHEHAAAVRLLVSQNLGNSALALMRVLFESVVRQMWAGMCASPKELDILYADLSTETLDDSASLPMAKRMLLDLEKEGPAALCRILNEFVTYSWKPLNSVVHSSIHALHLARQGLSVELASRMIKQSNNLLHMSGYQIALQAQCIDTHEAIFAMYSEFDDCLQK